MLENWGVPYVPTLPNVIDAFPESANKTETAHGELLRAGRTGISGRGRDEGYI